MHRDVVDPSHAEQRGLDPRLAGHGDRVGLVIDVDVDVLDHAQLSTGIVGGDEIIGNTGGIGIGQRRVDADCERGRIERLGEARAGIHGLAEINRTAGQQGDRDQRQGKDHRDIAAGFAAKTGTQIEQALERHGVDPLQNSLKSYGIGIKGALCDRVSQV